MLIEGQLTPLWCNLLEVAIRTHPTEMAETLDYATFQEVLADQREEDVDYQGMRFAADNAALAYWKYAELCDIHFFTETTAEYLVRHERKLDAILAADRNYQRAWPNESPEMFMKDIEETRSALQERFFDLS